MTKEELNKKFAFAGNEGICSTCAYVEFCGKMLPGFNKPRKCGGPFYKEKDV